MKTAMQELLDQLDFIDSQDDNYKNIAILSTNNVRHIIKGLKLIEKEKEQIIDAHNNAVISPYTELYVHKIQGKSPITKGEEYYNQTYNQKIPELLYKDGTPIRKVKLGKEAQELLDEIDNEKKGDLVRLLRWVLKHYSTGTDIDGFFMWENPMGKEFDSMQVVDHYLNQNK